MIEFPATFLDTACRLTTTQSVLIGVSGGPDSLCLLDLLNYLGYPLVVAHLNHMLRPEADQEAQLVARAAQERGLQCVLGKEDTQLYAQAKALSIEEAARTVRYRFLFEQARVYAAQAVVVAHTADDQVETVLMHFLRGAGTAGLIGMAVRALPNTWSQAIPLVRPMLNIWREQILEYCVERKLQPVYDSSNQDLTIFRNRLRQELIPYLTSFNPAIKQVIWRSSQVIKGDDAVIQMLVEETWQKCVLQRGEGFVAIDATILASQPLGLQRRIIRQGIAQLRPGLRDVEFETIERTLAFLAAVTRPSQIDLVSNLRVVYEPGRLWMIDLAVTLPTDEWPQMASEAEIRIDKAGVINLKGNWQLLVEVVENAGTAWKMAQTNQDRFQVWLSADVNNEVIFLRTMRPGDRIQPMGMSKGTQKISDFMIDHKLPRRARHGWPLVCIGDKLAWVPGYRLGQGYQLTPTTRQAIRLNLIKKPVIE